MKSDFGYLYFHGMSQKNVFKECCLRISIARVDVQCPCMVFTVDLCSLPEIVDAQFNFYNVHIHAADQTVFLKGGLSVLYFLLSLSSGALAASISS